MRGRFIGSVNRLSEVEVQLVAGAFDFFFFFFFWKPSAAPVGLNGGIYAWSCDLRNDVGQIHGTIHCPLIHYNWGRFYLSERKKEKKKKE